MRRKVLALFVLAGLVLWGVQGLFKQETRENDPPAPEIRLLQFQQLTPLVDGSLAELQNSVDRVSEAVLQGHWFSASGEQKNLELTWEKWKTRRTAQLQVEQEITASIASLGHGIWSKDREKVLHAARTLTDQISRLSD